MYSHILFDMDDTVFDFQKAQFVSFKYVLAKYDITFSENIYRTYCDINHNLWRQFDKEYCLRTLFRTKDLLVFLMY